MDTSSLLHRVNAKWFFASDTYEAGIFKKILIFTVALKTEKKTFYRLFSVSYDEMCFIKDISVKFNCV